MNPNPFKAAQILTPNRIVFKSFIAFPIHTKYTHHTPINWIINLIIKFEWNRIVNNIVVLHGSDGLSMLNTDTMVIYFLT